MEEAEHSQYVAQLKAEFDSCDTTATGFLDREELMVLCQKLQLDAHMPLLLDTLLEGQTYPRVNFEEFKEGFVAVLSRSLDLSTSEDDSSYLEPVVPEEVKPKFVKGAKRYGRRSRPDSKSDAALTCDSEDSPTSRTEASDSSPGGVRRAKLRRSTSLESVESLKSDEEAGTQKEKLQPDFHTKGPQEEVELCVGGGVLMAVCDHLGLQQVNTEELDLLFQKLDSDLNDKVRIKDLQKVLCGSAPVSCSTPVRPADLQRAAHRAQVEETSGRSTSPSLLTATVGQRVLSRLDDGSGCTSTERIVALWTEEGIRNGWDILKTLDFPLEERVSLADLTLALDNELLVSGNGIHQAALISYKNEIQHLQVLAEQACKERDKVKVDLDLAGQRNLQLVREVDDRHASMETLNQSRIRDLEQDFRDRLVALRSQTEQESEAWLLQVEGERGVLQDELQLLRAQGAELQEELCSVTQENGRLEEELSSVRLKLTEAENSVIRLQKDLDKVLHDKFGSLDAAGAGLTHEERFSEIIKEYELQCRDLQDRNDELSSELELLKSQRSDRKSRPSVDSTTLSCTQESDSDDSDMKRSSSPLVRRKLQPADKSALCSLESVPGSAVSIQTEMALEQLQQKHDQELQQLHIQLETQVNYYERSLELMRQSMEVERKDISQAFKLEISELEEQKGQVEQQVKQLKETVDKLQVQIQRGGGGWGSEQERRAQRERAELEQNFAREISNLVQRLSTDKDQLEAELKLKLDQEVMLVREESEQQLSQMKLQHAEGQRRLLHRLHREHQRLQEQRAFWESKLAQSNTEKRGMEERHKEEVCQLKNIIRSSSQSEASLEEFRQRCSQLEDDLKASHERNSELKARLEEKSSVEEELHLGKVQVLQLKDELENLQAASKNILQDHKVVAENCSHLSKAFVQQQVQLRESEQMMTTLRSELEGLQEATRTSTEKLNADLDLLKMDRARLIQDLKDQAMAVDYLQLELDRVSEELDGSRSSEKDLQEALKQERTRTSQLQVRIAEEAEEVGRLSLENSSYTRLADQLSTQIVEMEEEITTLRDHLRELSSQLNGTADLVLDLRKQLNSKTCHVDQLRAEVVSEKCQLEAKIGELKQVREQVHFSQKQLRTAEQVFEQEKKKMTQQLMELERLVLALEEVMDPANFHRTQLEEARLENGALQERLNILHQEIQNLEDDISKKQRKLEEMGREHEKSRADKERLHKENSKYREEVLELSSRNLQLSNDNAELSARLCEDQESVRMLQERLATVSNEQEEESASVQRLQQQAERELDSYKDKVGRMKVELSSLIVKQQQLEEEKTKLLRGANERNNKVENLQQSVLSLESEVELLRSQLGQEKVSRGEEVTDLQRELLDANNKMEELETSMKRLIKEKEELQDALEFQEEQGSITLQEENHKLRVQNQELQQKLSELQFQSVEVQNLKTKLDELETARSQAQDQALRADTALGLERAQQVRRTQQLQEQAGHRERAEQLQAQLVEEERRSRQLEETLKLQAQQSSSQISVKQDQYEKALGALQQRTEELETKLKGARMVLQEKVEQLKEQMAKSKKSSMLLKDLYVENSQLMKALQVTEQRQKNAEQKNVLLEGKVNALNKLLREIVPAALAT